jgi:hypothetical protein
MLVLMTTAPLIVNCAGANFDERLCPREQEYSREQQIKMADELNKAGPTLRMAFRDYGKLRDKARACREG